DFDVTGDEKTAVYQFVPNTSAYITGKPAVISTYDGVGTAGALLSQSLIDYDGATTWNQAPTVGKPTQSLKWLDTTGTYLSTRASYDNLGNVISESNETNATTTYTMDPIYHQY